MNTLETEIAHRLERRQRRFYAAQLLARLVYAGAAIAALLVVIHTLGQVHDLQEDNARRQECVVDLALLLADPARDRTKLPVPPPSCEDLPPVEEEE